MRDHRKLEAFTLAHELVMEVYRVTKTFPKEELFGLTSQLRRSAMSIPSNIVEGSARSSEKEYLRFLEIAHSSARELGYQLLVAKELGYFDPTKTTCQNLVERVAKILAGILRSLQAPSPKPQAPS